MGPGHIDSVVGTEEAARCSGKVYEEKNLAAITAGAIAAARTV